MRELPEIGSHPAGLTGDEKAILLHEFCEMLSAFAWPFIREANGPAGIADRGCSITYTLLNPEQWPKNVVHVLMDGREHSLHGFKMEEHYFDDLKVGDRFKSEPLNVTEKQVIEFAHKFDPQMFHLSRKAAERTIFKGLIASGWHTAAMSMRLLVQMLNFAEGAIGLGVDELRWPNVVRPGDVLTLETEIVDRRPSRSKPKYGIIRLRNVTKNQRGEIVQTMLASAMLPRR
jgi:acyl dehydratase